jgi:predicted transposase/invertase (TIGR01784 family)
MDKKPLSPTNDFVFKKIFGENMTVLGDFLKSVLDLPAEEYQGLVVADPHLQRENITDKFGILDVKIRTKSGKSIDVEVQVKAQPSIWKRMQFYTAKMLVEQVKSGEQYEQITRAVSILIADFVLMRENDVFHNRFRFYDEKTKARFPESMEINVLEIPKVREANQSCLSDWIRFFAAREEEEFTMLAQRSPAIAEAWGVLKVLSADEEARLLAESREKARMDFEDRMDGALRKGRLEGRMEGRLEGRLEVARKLLRKKMSFDDIVDATDLSLEEVKQLASSL